MHSPLVSVVIPAHNAAPWIVETVQSVCRQSWVNLEVIVVDDGSTDSSAEQIRGIADERVRLLRQQNAGAAAARNYGLRESRGDFLQFLDADDLLSPEKIASQIAVLDNSPPRAVASCAWYPFSGHVSSAERNTENVWNESDPVRWLVRSLAGEGMMQTACWLLPRSVVNDAGPWNETLSLHDDGEYFARILVNAAKNVFVDGPAVFYRRSPGSLSRQRGRPGAESALSVCFLQEATLLGVRDSEEVRSAVATRYAQFAYEFASAHPDLGQVALRHLEHLAQPSNSIGGLAFRSIVALAGFRVALRLRLRLRAEQGIFRNG